MTSNEPSLTPAVMNPPRYGTNYRQSAVLSMKADSEAHQAMLSGKPISGTHLIAQNGGDIANANNSKHVIPNIQTGVSMTPMAHSALTGTANSTLQIQENSAYDEFDPNKPISSSGNELKKNTTEGFQLIQQPLEQEFTSIVSGEWRINKQTLGTLAIITGIISFLPILFRMHDTRNTSNFTWINLTLALVSNILWFLYGYLTKSFANIVSGVLYFLIYLYIVNVKINT